MKLWLLRPVADADGRPIPKEWERWYDRTFGFVVRAEDEAAARRAIVSHSKGIALAKELGEHGGDRYFVDALGWGAEVAPDFSRPLSTTREYDAEDCVWLDPARTTCVELTADGPAEVVLTDHRPA